MRPIEDLEEAIAEGRGVLMPDGTLVTTTKELDDALAKIEGEEKSSQEPTDGLDALKIGELRDLPEAEGIPANTPKAQIIAAIRAKRAETVP